MYKLLRQKQLVYVTETGAYGYICFSSCYIYFLVRYILLFLASYLLRIFSTSAPQRGTFIWSGYGEDAEKTRFGYGGKGYADFLRI